MRVHMCGRRQFCRKRKNRPQMKFLFLCAWVSGSDSAHDNLADPFTGVNGQSDLLPQYKAGNRNILTVGVCLPDNLPHAKDIAYAVGCREAFSDDYTAYDTVSICLPMEDTGLEKFLAHCTVKDYSK